MDIPHQLRPRPQAPGDDHPPVLGERISDRLQGLVHRLVDEATGVDDDQIGPVVGRRQTVALGTKPGKDALRVDRRLGASEADKTNRRGAGCHTRRPQ